MFRNFLTGILFGIVLMGCDSRDLERLTSSVSDPDKKPIDQSILGVNNFYVNSQIGSIDQQNNDIKNTLGIKHVRVLFAWTDDVQRDPEDSAYVGFYDEIIRKIPEGMDVLVVVAHTPGWITNSANWIDGNPRKTWVERWFKPLVKRYAGNSKIVGWEVWNEPDLTVVPSDMALGLEEAANYYEMLEMASRVVRTYDPGKKILIASTQSINQKFPNTLNYNKRLVSLGAESLVDVWNIHYYGKNYDTVVVSNGISDFLNTLTVPVWVTESGQKGIAEQLEYGQRTWPFLQEEIGNLERIYIYEYSSTAAVGETYGLRTNDQVNPVSDLYIYLRDN